jgi:hypothetical protein
MDGEFNLGKLPTETHYALRAEGYLRVDEGYHVFALRADDAARLYIGDQLVIDSRAAPGRNKFQTYLLPLQKGFYPIRLEYLQRDGERNLNLFYAPPGNDNGQMIPWDRQYSQP